MISINGTERIASALRRQGLRGRVDQSRVDHLVQKHAYARSRIAMMPDGHFDD